MERVCEPELMDDPAQALAYAQADFAASDQALALTIAHRLGPGDGKPERILDLGCGPGNISLRLAACRPGARVLGLDGAAAMLELAVARQRAEPAVLQRLHFHRSLLPLPADWAQAVPGPFQPPYNALVSNSLLHHLHDPQVLWRSLRPLAAPGALVVMRDLRRPATPAALDALVARHAAGAPALLRRDFAHSLRAAFRPEEVREQLAAAGLEHLQVCPWQDRYLDIWGPLL